MILFIALPLASVFVQSFQITQPVVEQAEVETCTAGFLEHTCTTEIKTTPVLDENGRQVTMTSSPGPMPSARMASSSATLPFARATP